MPPNGASNKCPAFTTSLYFVPDELGSYHFITAEGERSSARDYGADITFQQPSTALTVSSLATCGRRTG